jgi:hypothetical protein
MIRVTFGDWIIQTPAASQKKWPHRWGQNKRGDWQEKKLQSEGSRSR